jgi:hypothetical protein
MRITKRPKLVGTSGTRKWSGGGFYGNEMPSWDELSEGAKDTLSRAYDLIFRGHYGKERSEAIARGVDPKELPESPGTTLEVLYYLNKAKKHEDRD